MSLLAVAERILDNIFPDERDRARSAARARRDLQEFGLVTMRDNRDSALDHLFEGDFDADGTDRWYRIG